MCGICGIATVQAQTPSQSLLTRMRDLLVHRGPDDAGIHLGPHIGLGHRRLSIVDVAHGHQPMYSDDGRFVIVYNGEVFNHPVLKPQLERIGQTFHTNSDTETLLHLFERHGEDCVAKLRGMFAFAIWDNKERSLFLARDRFGVKPLYYAQRTNGTFVFGSEIKALLPALNPRPALNIAALPDYLANHAPSGEETLFEGIRRLPAGHFLWWKDGQISLRRYWHLPWPGELAPDAPPLADDTSIVREFLERFTEAVRIRLMSDVPLGVFLSGGIDSAAITATMARLVPEPIHTFSVAFQERAANELEYARMVAGMYGTHQQEVIVSPQQFFDKLPQLIWHEDEPIGHPSSIPLYFVAELASRTVKVVLTGEGSDELLAGYNRYRVGVHNARLGGIYHRSTPAIFRKGIKASLAGLPKSSRLRAIASRTFLMRDLDLGELYLDNFAVFPRASQRTLLSPQVFEQVRHIDPYDAQRQQLDLAPGTPLLDRLLHADAATYLQELLMKQDQMSMAASVESRVPFLDHELAGWISQLPQRLKLRGTTTKWLLREAMRDRLPKEILRRKKMGFPVPVGDWLRGRWRPLLDDVLDSPRAQERGVFAPEAVRQLIREHDAGVNHTQRLWSLINFELWARMHLDGEGAGVVLPQVA